MLPDLEHTLELLIWIMMIKFLSKLGFENSVNKTASNFAHVWVWMTRHPTSFDDIINAICKYQIWSPKRLRVVGDTKHRDTRIAWEKFREAMEDQVLTYL